jgi:hypothetical protein
MDQGSSRLRKRPDILLGCFQHAGLKPSQLRQVLIASRGEPSAVDTTMSNLPGTGTMAVVVTNSTPAWCAWDRSPAKTLVRLRSSLRVTFRMNVRLSTSP